MDPTLDLIRQFEGYRDTPYWDVNAYRTGYGSDTVTMADGSVVPVTQGMKITREDAERDLARRVGSEFTPRAASAVGEGFGKLTPEQQAALVSITYNYGSLPDSVASAAASGDPAKVAAAIRGLGSHNDGVNRDRRNKEADLFLGGNVSPYAGGGSEYAGAVGGATPPPGLPNPNNALNQPKLNVAIAGNDVNNFLRQPTMAQYQPLQYERRNILGGV